ncbi:hypothetical protein TNCV_4083631 [Trichonephila clavipes]|nr:hypothetical protein TNCV_4083631 [Trichonephila clavipes]
MLVCSSFQVYLLGQGILLVLEFQNIDDSFLQHDAVSNKKVNVRDEPTRVQLKHHSKNVSVIDDRIGNANRSNYGGDCCSGSINHPKSLPNSMIMPLFLTSKCIRNVARNGIPILHI